MLGRTAVFRGHMHTGYNFSGTRMRTKHNVITLHPRRRRPQPSPVRYLLYAVRCRRAGITVGLFRRRRAKRPVRRTSALISTAAPDTAVRSNCRARDSVRLFWSTSRPHAVPAITGHRSFGTRHRIP